MAVNLVTNVQKALHTDPVGIHCWLDSTVVLYWIKGQEEYRQFDRGLTEFIRFSSLVKSHGIMYRPQRIQLI